MIESKLKEARLTYFKNHYSFSLKLMAFDFIFILICLIGCIQSPHPLFTLFYILLTIPFLKQAHGFYLDYKKYKNIYEALKTEEEVVYEI